MYAPCKIFERMVIDQFVFGPIFSSYCAGNTVYYKIFRAVGYKKKSREPAEEGLQSLHCADCHGESYYILHIFLRTGCPKTNVLIEQNLNQN